MEADAPQSAPFVKRHGAYLPHWTREGATYAVTFRLADSLPQEVLRAWLAEREHIVRRAASLGRPLSPQELDRLSDLHSERVERYLDAGMGECHLRRPEIAAIVRDALLHFDHDRYVMIAWCVMPNHVHVVVRPAPGRALAGILHSWKSFTAVAANKLLDRHGALWQPEYYDHLVRGPDDLARQVAYVMWNPTLAGLDNWPWVGRAAGGGVEAGDTGRMAVPQEVHTGRMPVPQEEP